MKKTRKKKLVNRFLRIIKFGHFDTRSFRDKSTRSKLKSFRVIIKVDSIHVESRFDSTQPICSQLFSSIIPPPISRNCR